MNNLELLELLYPAIDEDVLVALLAQAEMDAKAYCHLDELPESLDSIIVQMVEESLTKRGAEGLQSENAGGNSVSYLTDYSDKVYRVLNRHKHVRVVG